MKAAKKTLPPPAKQLAKRNIPMSKYGVMKIKTKSKLRKMDFEKLKAKEIIVSEDTIKEIEKQALELKGKRMLEV